MAPADDFSALLDDPHGFLRRDDDGTVWLRLVPHPAPPPSLTIPVVRAALRWQGPAAHAERTFEPLGPKHHLRGLPCAACSRRFVAGDVIGMVPIGPGEDQELRQRARAGAWYSAHAVVAHRECITGGV